MAYSEQVAERVRVLMKRRRGFSERKMFGGIAFMIQGHMCCGILNDELMLRLGDEQAAAALQEPHTRPMDFTGKAIKSMLFVSPPGFATEAQLKGWIDRAVHIARTLPPK